MEQCDSTTTEYVVKKIPINRYSQCSKSKKRIVHTVGKEGIRVSLNRKRRKNTEDVNANTIIKDGSQDITVVPRRYLKRFYVDSSEQIVPQCRREKCRTLCKKSHSRSRKHSQSQREDSIQKHNRNLSPISEDENCFEDSVPKISSDNLARKESVEKLMKTSIQDEKKKIYEELNESALELITSSDSDPESIESMKTLILGTSTSKMFEPIPATVSPYVLNLNCPDVQSDLNDDSDYIDELLTIVVDVKKELWPDNC